MKQLRGTCYNIQEPYIGKVDAIHKNLYILRNNINDECLICDKLVHFNKLFFCKNIKLNIGDIVKILPSGVLIVLYEATSSDNALFVSERCNNNCIMCPQVMKKVPSNFLDETLEIINLIDISPQYLGITGGEPTIEWKNLLQIIKCISEHHPQTNIQLLTNGRIFKNEYFVEEIKNISENILYCIPLYSDNAKIHDKMVGRIGAFTETVEGLYNLAKYKLPIELRTVLTKLNYRRLVPYTSWVYRNLPFISHLSIMGMEPIYQARKNITQLWIDPTDYYDELYTACHHLIRNNLHFFIYNHQLCVVHKNLRRYCYKTISDFKLLYLDECLNCTQKSLCGGFFQSAKEFHSKKIQAIKD